MSPRFLGLNDFVFKQPGHIERGVPVVQLFKNGRAGSTLLLWVAFFMCLLMIYGLNTWLPKLFDGAGLPVSGLVFLLAIESRRHFRRHIWRQMGRYVKTETGIVNLSF